MSMYRFKIQTHELENEMIAFATQHMFETRDVLKKSFENWLLEDHISDLMEDEKMIMVRNKYKASLETKLFKSIKYYHIKNKLGALKENPVKVSIPQAKKVKQVTFSPSFRSVVKKHIMTHGSIAPAKGFESFQNDCIVEITEEIQRLSHVSECDFLIKMKKMYKNQHYVHSKSLM